MYCPKCATQNAEPKQILMQTTVPLEPSPLFCRSCGANLSLIPQALTGRLPFQPKHRKDLEHGGPATLANGISKLFMGVGFLLVSFACYLFAPAGRLWWFWMLIPAFAMLGKGIAEIVSVKLLPTCQRDSVSKRWLPNLKPERSRLEMICTSLPTALPNKLPDIWIRRLTLNVIKTKINIDFIFVSSRCFLLVFARARFQTVPS